MGKRQVPTQPDFIKWLLLAGVAALVAFGGYYVYWKYWRSHSAEVDRSRYPIAGIDVSKHNGDIDFSQVVDDNYQFVFIKASEGKTYRDDAFDRNYRKAREAGLMIGAYHFFRKNRTGKEQVDNLLGVVKDKHLDLPLVIDLEDDWGNGATTSRETAIERVIEMVRLLNDKGYQVIIYTNLDGYEKYYKKMLVNCDLWLCSFTTPDLLPHLPHCFQQYSHEGTVAGVKGKVDLNVFRGSKGEWEDYLKQVNQPN